MKKYAKVIVRSNTIYTDNLFTYQIPVFLSDVIKIGHRILVPLEKVINQQKPLYFNLQIA